MKALPGRKTDVKDAEWIAQLLRHGLLKASFIPDRNQRELRELVRYRRSIIEERAKQHNRIQKVLEGANIKLGSVAIAVPTGVKIFNWLFTLWKGKIVITTPMLYSLLFIPIFTIGGVTGVMLGMSAADYQYHNTMFLVAHFHMVIIPGVVFAMLAGFHYYWPKMFGFILNEKLGKWTAWIISMSTLLAFMPMFFSGLDGQARRMYTYSETTGFGIWNMLSFIGAIGLAIGFILIVYNVYYSTRYASRDISSDPWDARSLGWVTHSPVPEYNFAIVPNVNSVDALWDAKYNNHILFPGKYEKIHMPNNSGFPFILGCIFFAWGFSFVFGFVDSPNYYNHWNLCLYGASLTRKRLRTLYLCQKN
jgi:cytochrome aa3-600 menaquinol oxidase subunit 1